MFKKSSIALLSFLVLAACSSGQPRVIQASGDSPEVTVRAGMATQIEMPDRAAVQTVAVGNPNLLAADKDGDIVNLTAKGGTGDTNLIIRARAADGDIKLFQYHIIVQDR